MPSRAEKVPRRTEDEDLQEEARTRDRGAHRRWRPHRRHGGRERLRRLRDTRPDRARRRGLQPAVGCDTRDVDATSPRRRSPRGTYAITANGSFDQRARSGEMTMDLSGIPGFSSIAGGGSGQVRMVFLYPDRLHEHALPRGQAAGRQDVDEARPHEGRRRGGSSHASSLSSLNQSDPTQFLELSTRQLRGDRFAWRREGERGDHHALPGELRAQPHCSTSSPSSEQAAAKAALEKLGAGPGRFRSTCGSTRRAGCDACEMSFTPQRRGRDAPRAEQAPPRASARRHDRLQELRARPAGHTTARREKCSTPVGGGWSRSGGLSGS